ncbi:MAG: molybdopterin oxidoreductase, partial [Clostridia bacterium]|nr:molybdopterin oxidoreductase [Clostridia bacterium]
ALEVPGGHLGTRVLFSGPVKKSADGFLEYPFNPTTKGEWKFPPGRRDGTPSLCPLTGPFLGPLHLAWKWTVNSPENWPAPSAPEVFITYKVNPVISQFDTPTVIEVLSRIPFHVAFAYTLDETTWFADLVLPEDGDLETLQIFPVGGTTFFENFWEHAGLAIKQPVVPRQHNTRNITDITTDLAEKLGMLAAYNEALNYGAYLGIALKGTPHELQPDRKYTAEEIYDRICKAGTRQFSQGAVEFGLDWFKENGAFFGPFPKIGPGLSMGPTYMRPWYLYPYMKEVGIRFELPYQERLKRIGEELKARLQEAKIDWWKEQAEEYQALPEWHDITKHLDNVTLKHFGKNPKEYPFWLLATRSMQYAWGSNVGVPMMHEMASQVLGHT